MDAKDLAEKMQRLSTEVSKNEISSCPNANSYLWLLYTEVLSVIFQRSDESAAGDAQTSGSVSPADFFNQTPNENFQIPVSCGKKNHSFIKIQFVVWVF